MINRDELRKYAEIVIKSGVNLYKGQCLNINSPVQNFDFATMLAEVAYKNGAKYVRIVPDSNELLKCRLENSESGFLSYFPDFVKAISYEQLSYDWAFIRIDNTEELDILKEADPEKLQTVMRSTRTALKRHKDELMRDKHTWCVICVPGKNWAKKVFNSLPEDEAVDKLWGALKPILRLDREEPAKEWMAHNERLKSRCDLLNGLNIDRVIFKGPDTELEVGLTKVSRWLGGGSVTMDGRVFMPNIPTEEIFTSPDFRRTNGKVRIVKPVKVMENLVEGACFEFKDGRVVDFSAESGEKTLEKYLSVDEGASFLGEVALVDINSPIYQSGILFNSILYDENASSHIALGSGYPICYSNSSELNSDDKKRETGCNVSYVHTDFMIGSEEVDVHAFDCNNKRVDIIKQGKFVI